MGDKQIIRSIWKSGDYGTVGIVLCQMPTGLERAYIGISQDMTEEYEARKISDYGTKLSFLEAKGFFPEIQEGKYYAS